MANIYDPRKSSGERLLAFGLAVLDTSSGGKGSGAAKAIFKMNPSEIHFTQDSISSVFKNGNTLESAIKGLKSGKISPNDFPPIRIFEKNGNLFSLDNRRLQVFKEAGIEIPTIRATPQEIMKENWKFTTKNGGESIVIK